MAVGSNDEKSVAGVTTSAYKQGVYDLIMTARLTYGDNIPIVWVYYTENLQYRQAAKNAIASIGGESADIYDIELLFNKLGGNSHPNLESHAQRAEDLAKFIQDKGILK